MVRLLRYDVESSRRAGAGEVVWWGTGGSARRGGARGAASGSAFGSAEPGGASRGSTCTASADARRAVPAMRCTTRREHPGRSRADGGEQRMSRGYGYGRRSRGGGRRRRCPAADGRWGECDTRGRRERLADERAHSGRATTRAMGGVSRRPPGHDRPYARAGAELGGASRLYSRDVM